jgi:hypothetical protein
VTMICVGCEQREREGARSRKRDVVKANETSKKKKARRNVFVVKAFIKKELFKNIDIHTKKRVSLTSSLRHCVSHLLTLGRL